MQTGAVNNLEYRIRKKVYKKFVKRLMDIILAFVGLIVLSPLILILVVLIRVKLGSPVIFKQERPGLNEKIFVLHKFRTMTNERDKNGVFLPDEKRLTKFGKFLRSTSLDELPELWNILKGDMSIIGPRPQLVRDMVFMSKEQRERHSVRPGLSGLAQVNGRNGITWESKLEYDLKYINNITFIGDWKLIFQTVKKVLKKNDINTEGMATAEDFGDYLLQLEVISQDIYNARQEEASELLNNYLYTK